MHYCKVLNMVAKHIEKKRSGTKQFLAAALSPGWNGDVSSSSCTWSTHSTRIWDICHTKFTKEWRAVSLQIVWFCKKIMVFSKSVWSKTTQKKTLKSGLQWAEGCNPKWFICCSSSLPSMEMARGKKARKLEEGMEVPPTLSGLWCKNVLFFLPGYSTIMELTWLSMYKNSNISKILDVKLNCS